jgi:gliding motility-associated-like protein
LSGSGNGSFLWSPPLGLSAADTQKPMATLDSDQAYVLTVTTTEGCVAKDTILIRTFKGPAIYVPDAFTPNGDGRNDLLKPVYVGIRQLKQFSVYDRWGRQVFSTKEMGRGWSGAKASAGTYVWLIQATDSNEKPVLMKGTVTIIR